MSSLEWLPFLTALQLFSFTIASISAYGANIVCKDLNVKNLKHLNLVPWEG